MWIYYVNNLIESNYDTSKFVRAFFNVPSLATSIALFNIQISLLVLSPYQLSKEVLYLETILILNFDSKHKVLGRKKIAFSTPSFLWV